MKLAVITVSTREGRVGGAVGKWFERYAQEHGGFDDVTAIDLKEVNLPVLDEPKHPVMREYQFEHTKRFSALIDPADAFVFVTPEYDYFAPGALVNAVDYLSQEWSYKPAAFVGYGGISGGLRSIQAAKPLLTSVKIMPLPESVSVQFVQNFVQDGVFTPQRMHEDMARLMLDELAKWAKALKPMRTHPATDAAE
ncbi:MAG TPA: NADPH-dependent FMN reductase [Candidatus Saccharimonadales bacterium]